MQTKLEALTQQILKKITPSPEEYGKVEALSKKLEQKIVQGMPATRRKGSCTY